MTTQSDPTVLRKMTLGEFQAYQLAELDVLEQTPDKGRIALLKRANDMVKLSGVTDPEGTVVVEIRKDATADSQLVAVLDKMTAIEEKLDRLAGTPAGASDDGDPANTATPSAKADDETAVTAALATEALGGMIRSMESLKAKVDSGDLTAQDVDDAFENTWALRNLLEAASVTLSKGENPPDADLVKKIIDKMAPLPEETPAATPAPVADDSTKGRNTDQTPVDWGTDLSLEAMADDPQPSAKAKPRVFGG